MTHEENRTLTRLYRERIRPVLGGIDTAHPISADDVAEVDRRLIDQSVHQGRDPNSPERAAWRAYTDYHACMLAAMMAASVEVRAGAARMSLG